MAWLNDDDDYDDDGDRGDGGGYGNSPLSTSIHLFIVYS